MTQRDHELIAAAIEEAGQQHRRSYGDRWPLDGQTVIQSIADTLAGAHPDFDRSAFLTACGAQ